jgi:hypothetical protein
MPKLRNAATDIAQFTQWLGRKCRNHHPLQELDLAPDARQKQPRIYKAKGLGEVSILASADNVLLYETADRVFEITVQEVSPATHKRKKRLPVGS